METKERLLSKAIILKENKCWIWTARRNKRGAGVFWMNDKNTDPRRASWILYGGNEELLDKYYVGNYCENKLCINPKHLFLRKRSDWNKDNRSVGDRFWGKVDVCGEDECWEWKAGKFAGGYGCFWNGSKRVKSHRVSWEFHFGEISNGLFICHHCDNPSCCNPNHLFLGTNKDNLQDASKKGRCNPLKGEECHNSKLTEKDVREIRFIYSYGHITYFKLADMYGVSFQHIEKIVHRKKWAWLD